MSFVGLENVGKKKALACNASGFSYHLACKPKYASRHLYEKDLIRNICRINGTNICNIR
jgi:hypothetical protein